MWIPDKNAKGGYRWVDEPVEVETAGEDDNGTAMENFQKKNK